MKIIILQNIKGLGQIGDIKNVSDGYARNFLLPRKMAKLATEASIKEVDALKKKLEVAQKLEKENASKVAEQLKDVVLEFTRKATKTGKIYSAVTKEDIAEILTKQLSAEGGPAFGWKIEPNSVNLEGHDGGHIKQLGEHLVKIELAPDVVAEVKVKISQEEK
ncbi:MAG: 50S ribosomal protein L9 [Candidatus Yanofskybacteria bacterium RIFCSPHIGHO2_01_FULL_42_12]|uniref:Large ribosomal subunit protein bL9 n=1 Tax=Candidatus Yanofskybacteria bacterium RIFCSPLOWO2_01_FULL_42_49 TaxID=1802694 RepID=A0A1F8GBP4_9BACT|nr:MAG: 50S ribosomal protein L9 [Candidatus Yanofskybacteria bacterium RIFCSPHIGHO2_01_FULL_42_12]OGN22797.1 MAG: 50S ribosomal protein L9 [Candidatus Yanofskybacteria bacterium RIFCSPLOWO2_01_FULL_42_49]